jgi:hypothetical protein
MLKYSKNLYEKILRLIYDELIRIRPRRLYFLVVGSIAKNEISYLELKKENGRLLILSDLDLIVLADSISFIKYKLLEYNQITVKIAESLERNGIKTHISLTLMCPRLYKLLNLSKLNTINLYEIKIIKCPKSPKPCQIVEKPKKVIVSTEDCLNLVISSIADYIFVLVNKVRTKEAIYIISKRILSLFYALELSMGLTPRGFTDVPIIAEKNLEKINNFVGENELKLLYVIANFKKNCDLSYLKQNIRNLGYNISSDNDLLQLLLDFFENYVKKVLFHFVLNTSNYNIIELINKFEKRYKRLNYTMMLLYFFVLSLNYLTTRNNKYGSLSGLIAMLIAILKYKLKLEDLLRILVLKFAVIMIYEGRNKVLSSIKLKNVGLSISNLWYKYMV